MPAAFQTTIYQYVRACKKIIRCVPAKAVLKWRKLPAWGEIMNYRLDKYGNKLSVLGFGCMRFQRKMGRIDLEEAEREILRAALDKLTDRERKIMYLRFGLFGGEEMTQKDVADLLGISQSYISRLEKKIILRLKKELGKMY